MKANVCLKECDTDWEAGMSYCQCKQFLQCAILQCAILVKLEEPERKSTHVKMHTKGSNVVNHAWFKNHQIDFDNALIINKANYCHLKTLESWHTAKTI